MCVCVCGRGLNVELKTVKLKDIFHLHYSIYLVSQPFHLSGLPGLEHFLSLPISAGWQPLPLHFIRRVAGTESKKQSRPNGWGLVQDFDTQEVLTGVSPSPATCTFLVLNIPPLA